MIKKTSDYGLIRLYSKSQIFIYNLVSIVLGHNFISPSKKNFICKTLYNNLCFIPEFFINLFKNSLFILAKRGYLNCIVFILLALSFIYLFSMLLFVLIGFGVGLLIVIYKTKNYEILFSLLSKLCKIFKNYLNYKFVIRLFSILAIIQFLYWIKLGPVFSIVLMIYIILLTMDFLYNIIKADEKEESLAVNLENILELVVRLSLLSSLLNILQDDNIIHMKIKESINKTSQSHSNNSSSNGQPSGNGPPNPDKGSLKYILNHDHNQSDDDKDKFLEGLYKKVEHRIKYLKSYSNKKLFDKNLGKYTFTKQEEGYILTIKSLEHDRPGFIRAGGPDCPKLAGAQWGVERGDCLVERQHFWYYYKAGNGKACLDKIRCDLEEKMNK